MRALLVGCGYVGSALGAELARLGHSVSGLRRNPNAAAELEGAGILPLTADITQPETLARLPLAYDWVVLCVASSGGGPDQYREVYLKGTRNLLAWLGDAPLRKFVYTSSTSVYGQEDGSQVDEASPTEPSSETAKVLLETERVLLEANRKRGFPAVLLRVAGIYGPGRVHWLEQFSRTGGASASDRLLNMIHRDDVVGALVAALEHGQPGRVYNAVDNEPATQRDVFRWLAGVRAGSAAPATSTDSGSSRKRALTNKRVSNRRLREELGYRFKHPTFREGFAAELARQSQ